MKKTIFYLFCMTFIFVSLLLVLFLNGCAQTVDLEVDIEQAALDSGISDYDTTFKIIFLNCSQQAEVHNFESISQSLLTELQISENISLSNGIFSLKTTKDRLTPVLIIFDSLETQSENQSEQDFIKRGIFYPICSEPNASAAFCAQVYIKLFTNSFNDGETVKKYCSFFNWKRFYQKVCTFETTYGSPFVLDDEKICASIAASTFSEYSFSLK